MNSSFRHWGRTSQIPLVYQTYPAFDPWICTPVSSSPVKEAVKEEIEKSMKDKDSTLRILVCTTAFGMGIDCQGVRSVIHWEPPSDIENISRRLAEEEGMVDPQQQCISNKSLTTTEPSMKDYFLNTSKCRRKFLMAHFLDLYYSDISGTCACCNVCKLICTCSNSMPK